MLSVNPADFDAYDLQKIRKFYAALISSMQLSVSDDTMGITPIVSNGDFICVGVPNAVTQFYFDVGNASAGTLSQAQVGNTPPTYPNRSFYHGSLKLNTYMGAAISGAPNYWTMHTSSGPVGNMTNWLIKSRTLPTAQDTNMNAGGVANTQNFVDQLDDHFFNFLRIEISLPVGATMTVQSEFLFCGIKIDY